MAERSLVRRLGWFVLLWAGGVISVGVVAWLIRLALVG
jgi:Protein of unknown function (DUF2474)